MKEGRKRLGQLLKGEIETRMMTHAQAAEVLGCSRTTVHKIINAEDEDSGIGKTMWQAIARFLGCHVESLRRHCIEHDAGNPDPCDLRAVET